jgi:transposase-like protein
MALHVDLEKQRCWLELVCLWQRSGLGVRVFCRRHRLSEPSFFAWRRKLQQRGLIDDRPTAKESKAAPASAFVQVAVAPATKMALSSRIEIILTKRRRLRVRPGFDQETLRQLVRLLEEEPPC